MFRNICNNNIFLAILSGILLGLSFNYLIFITSLAAIVPLIILIEKSNLRQSFIAGLIAGICFGLISCIWMIPLVQRYTGTETYSGIALTIFSALFLGVQIAIFSYLFKYLTGICRSFKYPIVIKVILAALIWVILEWLKMILFPGIPWLSFYMAITQSRLIYLIQLSSLTGLWGVSFIVIVINTLIAFAIIEKRRKYLAASVIIFTLNLIYGVYVVQLNSTTTGKVKFKTAIITENIPAETRWQADNADSLASVFINLNSDGAKLEPDLIIWTETAIPWRFSPDDDLIKMAVNKTKNTGASHLIGILTGIPYTSDHVYNSVYVIEPDRKVAARYDKRELLTLLEKPLALFNTILPFFKDISFNNIKAGDSNFPVYTAAGRAGIMICNESILPFNAQSAAAEGAEFLVNMSNDSWFENTFLIDQHFYSARMRAVENGKDIIINSNRGISGLINPVGEIIVQGESGRAQVLTGTLGLSNTKTFYTKFGDWFIYLSIVTVFLLIIIASPQKKLKQVKYE